VNFLTPWFLIGVSALAIPVLIHLIQRERKRVVVFPSLMFLRRIPYQSVPAAAEGRRHSADRRGVRAPVHSGRRAGGRRVGRRP
jgi:hypothetical protein